ncbi:MAG TPA: site-specific DNA-methyltransferase [Gaiellaceae bacterium]|nr:site-specific DNA-methyltransferase [Gaiellaceae bacterium]
MKPYVQDADFTLYVGDALTVLQGLPDGSVDCCVTSPPYLDARPEYGTLTASQWGTFFFELGRVVAGPVLLNVGRLWRDGVENMWWIDLLAHALPRFSHLDTLVWVKPNANPIHGAVLANSHEYVLVLGRPGVALNTDSVRTEYDPETLARFRRRYHNGSGVKGDVRPEEGRESNEHGARARSFFIAYVGREKGNTHPAPMPLDLAVHMVRLAAWPGHIVLDPFAGSGTTALAARSLGCKSIGIELNEQYAQGAARRLQQQSLFAGDAA